MKNMLIAVLVLSSLAVSLDASAEQKIVECGERYRAQELEMGNGDVMPFICSEVCATPKIEDYLRDGWKIDSNQPTEFYGTISDRTAELLGELLAKKQLINPNSGSHIRFVQNSSKNCVCLGTKYVLSKIEIKAAVTPEPDKNLELMKKEIELLKKEIEMLKKDREALKQENEALKKKATKKK